MSEILNLSYIKFLKKSGAHSFLQDKPNNYYQNIKKYSQIINNISDINNIEDLTIFIQNTKKNLNIFANNSIIGEGNLNTNIMLIGEVPTLEENKEKKPFVGNAGSLLDKMLAAIKINRKNIFLVNIIPWHKINSSPLTNEEIINTLPLIQKYIEIVKPKIILLLGSISTKAVLNSNIDIKNLRGKWHEYKSINEKKIIKCLPTYSPSHLLKFPNCKKLSWIDLQEFKKKIINENL